MVAQAATAQPEAVPAGPGATWSAGGGRVVLQAPTVRAVKSTRPRRGRTSNQLNMVHVFALLLCILSDGGVRALQAHVVNKLQPEAGRLEPGGSETGAHVRFASAAADHTSGLEINHGAVAHAATAAAAYSQLTAQAEAQLVDAIAGTVTFVFSAINSAVRLAADVKRARASLMREKFAAEVQAVVHHTQAALRGMSAVYAAAVGDVQRQVADVLRDVSLAYVQHMSKDSLRSSLESIAALHDAELKNVDAALQAWQVHDSPEACALARKALFDALRDDFDRLNMHKFMGNAAFEERFGRLRILQNISAPFEAALQDNPLGDGDLARTDDIFQQEDLEETYGQELVRRAPSAMRAGLVFTGRELTSVTGRPIVALGGGGGSTASQHTGDAIGQVATGHGHGGDSDTLNTARELSSEHVYSRRADHTNDIVNDVYNAAVQPLDGPAVDWLGFVDDASRLSSTGKGILEALSGVTSILSAAAAVATSVTSLIAFVHARRAPAKDRLDGARNTGISAERSANEQKRATFTACRLFQALQQPLGALLSIRADYVIGGVTLPGKGDGTGTRPPVTLKGMDLTPMLGLGRLQMSEAAKKRISVTLWLRLCSVLSPLYDRLVAMFRPGGVCLERVEKEWGLTGAPETMLATATSGSQNSAVGVPAAIKAPAARASVLRHAPPSVATCDQYEDSRNDIYDVQLVAPSAVKYLSALGYTLLQEPEYDSAPSTGSTAGGLNQVANVTTSAGQATGNNAAPSTKADAKPALQFVAQPPARLQATPSPFASPAVANPAGPLQRPAPSTPSPASTWTWESRPLRLNGELNADTGAPPKEGGVFAGGDELSGQSRRLMILRCASLVAALRETTGATPQHWKAYFEALRYPVTDITFTVRPRIQEASDDPEGDVRRAGGIAQAAAAVPTLDGEGSVEGELTTSGYQLLRVRHDAALEEAVAAEKGGVLGRSTHLSASGRPKAVGDRVIAAAMLADVQNPESVLRHPETYKYANLHRSRSTMPRVYAHILRGGVTPLRDMMLVPFHLLPARRTDKLERMRGAVKHSITSGGGFNDPDGCALGQINRDVDARTATTRELAQVAEQARRAATAPTATPTTSPSVLATPPTVSTKVAEDEDAVSPAFTYDMSGVLLPRGCTGVDTVRRRTAVAHVDGPLAFLTRHLLRWEFVRAKRGNGLRNEQRLGGFRYFSHKFELTCALPGPQMAWERVPVSPYEGGDSMAMRIVKPYLWVLRRYVMPRIDSDADPYKPPTCPSECAAGLQAYLLPRLSRRDSGSDGRWQSQVDLDAPLPAPQQLVARGSSIRANTNANINSQP